MPTFVHDTFLDTSGTALTAHTGETGATWTEHGSYATGDAVISNANRCRPNTTSLTCYHASGSPASAEYDVHASVVAASVTGRNGPAGRIAAGANTMYQARYDQPNTRWDLLKLDAGVATVLGSFTQTLSAGLVYTTLLEIRDAAKKVYVDGAEVITSTDNAVTGAGLVGFRANTGTDSTGLHLDWLTAIDAPVSVPAFQGAATTTGTDDTAEGTIPVGTAVGDLMVAFLAHTSSTATMVTPASGWTLQEADPNPADFSCLCYTRVYQAGDANPVWTWSAAGAWTVDVISFSGVGSVDVDIGEQVGAASSIALGPVTPTTNGTMLVGWSCIDATGSLRPWGHDGAMIEVLDRVDNAMHRSLAWELLSGGSGVGVSRTFTDQSGGSAQDIAGFLLAIAPASVGDTPTPGIASTSGTGPAAAHLASLGTTTGTASSPTTQVTVTTTIGMALGEGIAANALTSATIGTTVALGTEPFATTSVSATIVTTDDIEPSVRASSPPGVAVGRSTGPTPDIAATNTLGVAVTVGATLAAGPVLRRTLTVDSVGGRELTVY